MAKEVQKHCSTPEWLPVMLAVHFFERCPLHKTKDDNELKFFCIQCIQPECLHCLQQCKDEHEYIQIRKYHYNDVINVDDIRRYFNCSGIKTYAINRANVVHLRERPLLGTLPICKPRSSCSNCRRPLQDAGNYCCIACKVKLVEVEDSPSATVKSILKKDADEGPSDRSKRGPRKQMHPNRAPSS